MQNKSLNFIIPYAKPSGVTSFGSMSSVKKTLGTKKVGHTGTLDSFADGLLVLLSGQLTGLAEIISASKKNYDVWAEFGIQTDTLDPCGTIIKTSSCPSIAAIEKAIPHFMGIIQQTPPEFSAIKINGKRASDRIRSGETVILQARYIQIFDIHISDVIKKADGNVKYVRLTVSCSKGTYIRSLVRDLAAYSGSCAYVKALRRTAVGGFTLEQAVCASGLPDFEKLPDIWAATSSWGSAAAEKNMNSAVLPPDELKEKALYFTPKIAAALNLPVLFLNKKYIDDFCCGKKIKNYWFTSLQNDFFKNNALKKIAVFAGNEYAGLVSVMPQGFKYEAVIGHS